MRWLHSRHGRILRFLLIQLKPSRADSDTRELITLVHQKHELRRWLRSSVDQCGLVWL